MPFWSIAGEAFYYFVSLFGLFGNIFSAESGCIDGDIAGNWHDGLV